MTWVALLDGAGAELAYPGYARVPLVPGGLMPFAPLPFGQSSVSAASVGFFAAATGGAPLSTTGLAAPVLVRATETPQWDGVTLTSWPIPVRSGYADFKSGKPAGIVTMLGLPTRWA